MPFGGAEQQNQLDDNQNHLNRCENHVNVCRILKEYLKTNETLFLCYAAEPMTTSKVTHVESIVKRIAWECRRDQAVTAIIFTGVFDKRAIRPHHQFRPVQSRSMRSIFYPHPAAQVQCGSVQHITVVCWKTEHRAHGHPTDDDKGHVRRSHPDVVE